MNEWLLVELKVVLEASVRKHSPGRGMAVRVRLVGDHADWMRPSWASRALVPKSSAIGAVQGYSNPPKTPGVPHFEHGNLDSSACTAMAGEPPGLAMSRAGGGALVVVRAQESCAHGEGGQ